MKALICTLVALSLVVASGTPSRAEPVSIAILTALSIEATALAVSATTLALTVGVSVGVSYLQMALRKGNETSPDMPTGGSSGKLSAGGVVPRSTGVGKYMTGGSLVYANTFGQDGKTPNAYLTQVIALSDLPRIKLRQVWVNGAPCDIDVDAPQDEHGVPFPQFTFLGRTYLWLRFYDGTQTAADAKLVALFGNDFDRPYTERRVGFGVAYVVITALVKEEVFSGFPQFKFVGDGIPLYDRRHDSTAGGSGPQRLSDPDTWSFTETPAVIRENIVRGLRYDGQWQWGGQSVTEAQLPASSWMAAANECDAPIALAEGGTEPQFRAGGEIVFSATPADVLDELNKADNGRLAEIGGIYKTRSGAAGASVFHFTDAAILSDKAQTFEPFAPLASQVNHVTARYLSPAEGWNLKDAPALVDDDLELLDGRRVSTNADYGFVSSGTQVQRLMRSERDTARAWRRHALPLPPEAFVLEPLDVVSWTSTRNGYETKSFEIVSAEDLANLCMGVALKELDPTAYDWTPGVHQRPITEGRITVVRPAPQPIVAWFAEPYTLTVGERARPAILLGWDADTDDVDGIRFEVRLKDTAELQLAGEEGARVFESGALIVSQNLLGDTLYEARGQYRPASARPALWSDWLTVRTPDTRLQRSELSADLDAVVEQVNTRFTADLAIIRREMDQLAASMNGQSTGIFERAGRVLIAAGSQYAENSASIKQALITTAAADSALAALITQLEAAVDGANAAIDDEAITRAGADGALGARISSFLAASGFGTAEGRIRLIAASGPAGVVATYAIELNVSTTATPNWQPCGLYLDAMAGFSRLRLRFSLIEVFDAALNGGAPFALFDIAGGEAIFNALVRVRKLVAGAVDAADIIVGNLIVTGHLTADAATKMTTSFLGNVGITTGSHIINLASHGATVGRMSITVAFELVGIYSSNVPMVLGANGGALRQWVAPVPMGWDGIKFVQANSGPTTVFHHSHLSGAGTIGYTLDVDPSLIPGVGSPGLANLCVTILESRR